MPRRIEWTELMEDWPELQADQMHRVRVAAIRKGKSIGVTLELLDAAQTGRTIPVELSKPIHPSNLAGRFFAAVGQDVAIGEKLYPAQAVGKVLLARFAGSPETHGWQVTEFAPIQTEETDHGRPD